MLLSSIPPSFLQQLSPAPIPAELLVPLTYISLVGCSISVVASLLTILLHFQARYSPAPMPGPPTRCCSAPLLIQLIPQSGVDFSRGWGQETSLAVWLPLDPRDLSTSVFPSLCVREPRGWHCLGDVPRPRKGMLPPAGSRVTPQHTSI